ncbi:MAG: HPr family phosphocarrier protein [Lachnospiraceae bacterium]|nr:HPr family phosphocarrier protein [Eubacterium sp.]MBQ3933427.1 HPr family phosphocarrier protein [Lachnospiraceae bacterium]
MQTFNYVITDEIGIHARPAGLLVKVAKQFQSASVIKFNGREAKLTGVMGLIGLGVKKGSEVVVCVEGEDEETAVAEIKKFFQENL